MEPRRLLTNMLVFTAAPTSTASGSVIDSPTGVQVTVETTAGVKVSTTDSIVVSLGTNPTGTTLHGTLTVAAVSGVATFSTLYLSSAANGYKLTATDSTTPTTNSATSAAFNINAVPFFNTSYSLTRGNSGYQPYSGLVRDSSGNLYGTTEFGGLYDDGTVYELSGSTYATLVSFSGETGRYLGEDPQSNLILDSTGNLYGSTTTGGPTDDGTLFELSGTNHSVFTTLVSFTGDQGNYPGTVPTGTLAIDSSSDIFGTTTSGGVNNDSDGTAFELVGPTHTFKSLFYFTGSSGNYPGDTPDSGLILDTSGNLYGTTDGGGTDDAGQVFEIPASSRTTLTSVYSFIDDGGAGPNGLVLDSSNNIYGSLLYDGANSDGAVYELSGASHSTYTDLVDFNDDQPPGLGEAPNPGMVFYNGNLYGMTNLGGLYDSGSIFEVTGPQHTQFFSLASLDGDSQANPDSGFVLDSSGNLYGTTSAGGSDGLGDIIEIPVSNRTTVNTLYSFNSGSGAHVSSPLLASGGNFYGTTSNGGPTDEGTIFELSGTGYSTYTTIASFNSGGVSDQGVDPEGPLLVDGSGNFYGTTDYGGANGTGEVFELSTAHTLTNLYSFPGYSDIPDAGTQSNLTIDSSGNLYVAYTIGDLSNDGTVVELSGTNHATVSTLVSFTGTGGNDPGAYPGQILIYGSNLYGTTSAGGSNNAGTAFELSGTNHNTFTEMHAFNTSGGSSPTSQWVVDSSGNLYGTTDSGGTYGDGVVYELPSGKRNSQTNLINFNGSNGATPNANLIFDSSGNLYGTTTAGGTYGDGTVFELSGTSHTTFATLVSFSGLSGSTPGTSPQSGLYNDSSGNLYGATYAGGYTDDGTFFELSGTSHTTFTSLFQFSGDNIDPSPLLVADGSGNLFGSTRLGGTYSQGSIFELSPNGVANLNATSGTITIASPTAASAYFSSMSAASGATVALINASTGHSVIITTSVIPAGSTNNWTGKIDIANDDLDITNGSLPVVMNQILSGYNGGNWTGNGITSSNAAADTTHLTAIGVIQNNQSGTALYTSTNPLDGTEPGASDILVKYTYYGDANLDGKIDGSDYSLIDNGYVNHLTSWYNGDFNYDGSVNGSDYTLIDNAFNRQGASLASIVASPAAQVASATPVRLAATSASPFAATPISWAPSTNDVATEIFGTGWTLCSATRRQ